MRLINRETSPFVVGEKTTYSNCFDHYIALLPVIVWATWMFGFRSLVIILTSLVAFIAFDEIGGLVFEKSFSLPDASVVLRALIFSMLMPVTIPLYVCISAGAIAAIAKWVIERELKLSFLTDPILLAYSLGYLVFNKSFEVKATEWTMFRFSSESFASFDYRDIITDVANGISPVSSTNDILLGNYYGYIGCVCTIILCASLVYLLLRRKISIIVPITYLGMMALYLYFFPRGTLTRVNNVFFGLCSGTLLFVAVFIATLDGISPMTKGGKAAFGIICGLLTIILRAMNIFADGAMIAVLIATPSARYLDRVFIPKPFGKAKTI